MNYYIVKGEYIWKNRKHFWTSYGLVHPLLYRDVGTLFLLWDASYPTLHYMYYSVQDGGLGMDKTNGCIGYGDLWLAGIFVPRLSVVLSVTVF